MSAEKELRQEIAALQHELRRVHDALERGSSHQLEHRARQLHANIELCERDLERAKREARSGDG
jgi:hypothetical protein